MSETKWRRSEYFSVGTLFVVLGWIWYASARNTELVTVERDIGDMKPIVTQNSKDIAELRAVNTTQFSLIIRELDSMHKEIKKIHD